ncbi:MAG: hypothetical protein OSA06_05340 [Acidimicrobiales bacterium]|nr:hypothetical protein [Acidimicrobiales bacterium]
MLDTAAEWEFREGAFAYLRATQLRTGGPIKQSDVDSYQFRGSSFRLMPTQSGIWKPRQLSAALSFVSIFALEGRRPYEDHLGPDDFLRYKWQGDNADHPKNRALRMAMQQGLPLIYFKGIARAVYEPIFPVYLVGEEPQSQQFVIALDQMSASHWENRNIVDLDRAREYTQHVTKTRVHQPVFRSEVLRAYDGSCALCNLRHEPLLDAAHIKSDADGGRPIVQNGILMCKIHHAAYDANILGIRPDHEIRLRPDIMVEQDGPTLRYSLQGMNGQRIRPPRAKVSRPDVELLEERWEQFKESA